MLHFIYELYDPRTDTPGYVGLTGNPSQRYQQHIERRDGKAEKYEWVKRLLSEGVKPKLRILETVENRSEARIREKYWIKHYIEQGILLANTKLMNTSVYYSRTDEHVFNLLANDLRTRVKAGAYGMYGGLPSASELSEEWKVPYRVALGVLKLMCSEGLIQKFGDMYRVSALPKTTTV